MKNKYMQFKTLLPVCLTFWWMQFVSYHADSAREIKPEGITSLRIASVRRALLSLLLVTKIIMKLSCTCHDIEVWRPQLSKNSQSHHSWRHKNNSQQLVMAPSWFSRVLLGFGHCVSSLEPHRSPACLVMFCVSVWWGEMYRLH